MLYYNIISDQTQQTQDTHQLRMSSESIERDLRAEIGNICIPGMRISVSNDEFVPGSGTNEIMGYIYASVAGILKMTTIEERKITIISVVSPKTPSILPKTGDIVTCRVTVVNPRLVHCIILCVNTNVLTRSYRGIIKKEDIRFYERDQIDSYKCFKPGDIILAKVTANEHATFKNDLPMPMDNCNQFPRVWDEPYSKMLPMSEIHYYPLSTAENELGVVIAKAEGSPVGVNMVPISWSEMQCPKTLVKEKRKVAKVIPEKLDQNIHHHMETNGDIDPME